MTRCRHTCPAPLVAGMERCHNHAGHAVLLHAAANDAGEVSHWPVSEPRAALHVPAMGITVARVVHSPRAS